MKHVLESVLIVEVETGDGDVAIQADAHGASGAPAEIHRPSASGEAPPGHVRSPFTVATVVGTWEAAVREPGR